MVFQCYCCGVVYSFVMYSTVGRKLQRHCCARVTRTTSAWLERCWRPGLTAPQSTTLTCSGCHSYGPSRWLYPLPRTTSILLRATQTTPWIWHGKVVAGVCSHRWSWTAVTLWVENDQLPVTVQHCCQLSPVSTFFSSLFSLTVSVTHLMNFMLILWLHLFAVSVCAWLSVTMRM